MTVIYNGGTFPSKRGELCTVVKSIERANGPLYTLLFKDGVRHDCWKEYTISFTNYYEAAQK